MDVPRHPPTPGAGCHLPMLLPRFTAAPRALAVAGDATRRSTMELVLRRQGYAVTHCSDPVVAMAVLRDRGGGFARVVVDMFPPRGGALELLEFAIGEMRLHADVMSRAGDIYGPLVMKELDIFRQPITSKASNESRSPEARPDSQSNGSVTATASTTPSLGRRAATRRTRRSRQPSETASQEVEQEREHGQPAVQQQQEQPAQRSPKKARLIWTPELHDKFVDAYNKLLPSGDAVPKKILELMNEKTLTRENVASHLQKYRLNLKQEEQQFLPRASPTKHQRAPPFEASLLSPNMSQQHDIFMAQRTGAVYMNYGFIAQKVIRTPMVSGIQNNRQELHMQAFEAVNMNKENIVTMVHARDGSTGKVVGPTEMYSGAQVEHEFDIDPLNDLDGTFQEDLSTIIQQNLNKDPGPLWDYEFLYNSD